MTHSLYYKFIIGYLVFGLLGFITIATISSDMTYDFLLETKSDALYDEANMLASDFSQLYRGRNSNLNEAAPRLKAAATYLQGEAWIVDTTGHIVADSSVPAKTDVTLSDFDPTFMGNRSYTIGNCFGVFPYEVLSVSAPITGNYNTYGYVLVHLPISAIQQIKDNILNILYISSGIIFGLSLIILLVFTVTVYFPLKKITIAANQYAEGNLKHKLQLKTHDEMGYLEAILDGTIPPEMQEKYLTRVISETDRLNKLTQGLLTLNSLDSKGYLSRSNFDINRVIKDTAASFEGTCDSKNIVLDLTFAENITMVYADLGKIQQVLYNLIDNAIKFSHPDSTIFIQTTLRFEKVYVSVKDTGIGIPKDSIKKIWERFYKTDLSRGKDKKGTGLGLSIVKEIIQNHGETIDVISTSGVGSEFIFSLPRAMNL